MATLKAELAKAAAELEKAGAEGKLEGKIAQIQWMQGLLGEAKSEVDALRHLPLSSLDELFISLQSKLQSRLS